MTLDQACLQVNLQRNSFEAVLKIFVTLLYRNTPVLVGSIPACTYILCLECTMGKQHVVVFHTALSFNIAAENLWQEESVNALGGLRSMPE